MFTLQICKNLEKKVTMLAERPLTADRILLKVMSQIFVRQEAEKRKFETFWSVSGQYLYHRIAGYLVVSDQKIRFNPQTLKMTWPVNDNAARV